MEEEYPRTTIIWPPPPCHPQEKQKGLFASIWATSWLKVRAIPQDVVWLANFQTGNSGHPPLTQAFGIGLLQHSVRFNAWLACLHWVTSCPIYFITIWAEAAQHHMLVSCCRRSTLSVFVCTKGIVVSGVLRVVAADIFGAFLSFFVWHGYDSLFKLRENQECFLITVFDHMNILLLTTVVLMKREYVPPLFRIDVMASFEKK